MRRTGKSRVTVIVQLNGPASPLLNWLMANGQKHRVRVVNMSLGAPAVDSYKTDPLFHAVRRLVDAGFVVAAAGNDGKASTGEYGANTKTYGLIHTPGNKLVYAEALNNKLVTANPWLHFETGDEGAAAR